MENFGQNILNKQVEKTGLDSTAIEEALATQEKSLVHKLTKEEYVFIESYVKKIQNYEQTKKDIQRAYENGRSTILIEKVLTKIKKEIDLIEDYIKNDGSISENIKNLLDFNYYRNNHKQDYEEEKNYLEKVMQRNGQSNLDTIDEHLEKEINISRQKKEHSQTKEEIENINNLLIKQEQTKKNINNPKIRNLN